MVPQVPDAPARRVWTCVLADRPLRTIDWFKSFCEACGGEVIAIDG